MIDPIRMVFINILSSSLLVVGIAIYKYIYPKRNIHPLFLVVLASLLPLTSLLRAGTYESGDFNIHLYRIMSFYDSLSEGIFLPSWAAELNATYGNPLFIFNYCFSYYSISFFHFLGLTFVGSMKLYLAVVYVLSGISMFFFMQRLTKNNFAAVASSIFYLYNPYHLIDIHFRATLGESTVFAFAPFILYFIVKYFQQKILSNLLGIGVFTTITFLSHPLLALTIVSISGLLTIYLGLVKRQIKSIFHVCTFLFLGVCGSLYLLFPFILYAPYMYPNPGSVLSFNPIIQLFYAPWRNGFLFQGPYGELALMIGYSQILVVLMSIYLLIKKKVTNKDKYSHLFWLSIFVIFIFLMTTFSRFVWNFFPLLWMLIPTGRLLLPTALCTSVLAGYITLHYSKDKTGSLFVYLLIIFTVCSTILNWGHRRVIPEIGDVQLRQGVWKSTVNESITAYFLNNKWADKNRFWFSELPKSHIEILEGKGNVKELERTSIKHSYILEANTPLTIQENTLFFPGWTLELNNAPISIYPGKRGVITAKVPKGVHYMVLYYTDIVPYKISKLTSVGVFSTLLIAFTFLSMKIIFKRYRK